MRPKAGALRSVILCSFIAKLGPKWENLHSGSQTRATSAYRSSDDLDRECFTSVIVPNKTSESHLRKKGQQNLMGQLLLMSLHVVVRDRYLPAKQEKQVGLILGGTLAGFHSCICSLTWWMACHGASLSCLWSAHTDYRFSCEKVKSFPYSPFTREMPDLNTVHFYDTVCPSSLATS